MKSGVFAFILLALSVSVISYADGDFDPHCFDDPKGSYLTGDAGHIRGTCKLIQEDTSVSLDPSLESSYFIGWHEPICVSEGEGSCGGFAKYSETFYVLTASSSVSVSYFTDHAFYTTTDLQEELVGGTPQDAALFDKNFFAPLLGEQLANAGATLAENTKLIRINVLDKQEIDAAAASYIEGAGGFEGISGASTTVRMDHLNSDVYGRADYEMTTLDYLTYGKHIYAPKGYIQESQYVPVQKSPVILTGADLQVQEVYLRPGGVPFHTVPITSPLASVKDYWLFTKENGSLVLKWEKSEYGLDDGEVRTVTSADKNVTAALLFGSTGTRAAATSSEAAGSAAPAPEAPKGFFARIIDLLLSWFRRL